MEAVGDEIGVEEDGAAGDFGEMVGGVKDEEMAVVGEFKLHRLGFDEALAVAQGLAKDAELVLGVGGVGLSLKRQETGLELVEVEALIGFQVGGFDGFRFRH